MPTDHDLCFSATCTNKNSISNTLSFIFSNPLYLFYFIFFSPYLFKLIFFISFSPLFLTTTLFVLLSVIATGLPHSKLAIVDQIHSRLNRIVDDEENDIEGGQFEDFEIYKIVFCDAPVVMEDTVAVTVEDLESEKERSFEESMVEIEVEQVREEVTSAISTTETDMKLDLEMQKSETETIESSFSGEYLLIGESSFTEKSNSSRFDSSSSFGSYESMENSPAAIEMKSQSDHEGYVKLQPVMMSSFPSENQLRSRPLTDSPVKVVGELQKIKPVTSSISVISVNSVIENKTVNNLLQVDPSSSFGSYGSMRKEKDWKRTLACKLFEERRSLEGGEEGMDSLWESYETDNSSRKSQSKSTDKNKNKNKNKKKSEFKYFDDGENEEDGDDEIMGNGQLCCLKALKLSTGKMNLGISGKPNLVKISKALKGFGWLHHVGSKHGKKK